MRKIMLFLVLLVSWSASAADSYKCRISDDVDTLTDVVVPVTLQSARSFLQLQMPETKTLVLVWIRKLDRGMEGSFGYLKDYMEVSASFYKGLYPDGSPKDPYGFISSHAQVLGDQIDVAAGGAGGAMLRLDCALIKP